MGDRCFPSADAHSIDTNLFVAFERADAVDVLERAVAEHGIELLLPNRVYDELTPDGLPYDQPPVDRAIDDGWVRVLDSVAYSNPVVSETMDVVRRYIATADGRAEHEIEQADGEIGGATAMLLENGDADSVAVYTNDRAAFRGIERALTEHGYENRVQLVDAFDCYETILERYGV